MHTDTEGAGGLTDDVQVVFTKGWHSFGKLDSHKARTSPGIVLTCLLIDDAVPRKHSVE